jgi:hypothetical protein
MVGMSCPVFKNSAANQNSDSANFADFSANSA